MKPNSSSLLIRVPSAAWVILLMMIVFTAINPRYLTLDNVVNIILQNAVLKGSICPWARF
jgi:ribose/xylose/arabinose/galactoside ABC-type transport system permease subunit